MSPKAREDASALKAQQSAPKQSSTVSALITALDLSTDRPLSSLRFTTTFRQSVAKPRNAKEQRDDNLVDEHSAEVGQTLEETRDTKETEGQSDSQSDDSDESLVHQQFDADWGRLRSQTVWKTNPSDGNLKKRRKRARPWVLRAACLEVLKEDRLRALEKIMQTKGFMELEDAEGDKKASSESTLFKRGGLISTKLGWDEFVAHHNSKIDTANFAALLVEKPIRRTFGSHHLSRRGHRPMSANRRSDGTVRVERIRLNAVEASQVLQEVMSSTPPTQNEALIRPFKPLFAYLAQLKEWTEGRKHTLLVDNTSSEMPNDREKVGPRTEESIAPALGPEVGVTPPETAQEHNRTVMAEAILHMVDTELKHDMKLHLDCRERRKCWIQFDDLWHVFSPGDYVYDPKLDQALQVLCVQNGRTKLNPFNDPFEAEFQAPSKPFESKNAFTVLTFSIDSDGLVFGPVQRLYNVDVWEGERRITTLPIYPLEYADSAATEGDAEFTTFPNAKEASLRSRGRKFSEIANTPQLAHRDYRGFSLGKLREEVDSDVIIDIGLFYGYHPNETPAIGLNHPPQGDKREVVDTIHYVDPDRGSNTIYDDCQIEADRMNAFINRHRSSLLQRTSVGTDLTDDQTLLLPQGVWAYVLRDRGWYKLDVSFVNPLEQRNQSFDDLVLQPDYKRLVQSLVKTHSKGTRPTSDSVGRSESDKREHLVRGKGKGVIILLHGAPGVGKSSTAECVAEYTKRPLLSVTCGDIGQTADAVQASLEYHLNVAHRWGCVMLLDEADIFLAARDKRDFSRNAIVSVFLRVLEYYSGILFLTTNKIGTFDEAFKSRIHLSLYYDKLDAEQTWKIWDVNLTRQMKLRPHLSIEKEELLKWGERHYYQCQRDGTQVWNGRQIRNACQTAAALAEAEEKGVMSVEHLKAVARAGLEFDKYLKMVYGGDDADRVRRAGEREDAYTSHGRASYPFPDDEARYRDYYRERDQLYDYGHPERQMSTGRASRVFYNDRGYDRYDGRGNDREDVRYTSERQRSPAMESLQRPRDRFDGRASDREDVRFATERHMSPGAESSRRPRGA